MGVFRFEIGQRVRVVGHPARPVAIIVRRWTGTELGDVYGENIYEVSGFVTKQRESSLRDATGEAGIGSPHSSAT
jgi:hypothetical protein